MDCSVLAVEYGFGSQTLKVGIKFNSILYIQWIGEREKRG